MFRTKTKIEVGTVCKGENTKQIECNTEECPSKLALLESKQPQNIREICFNWTLLQNDKFVPYHFTLEPIKYTTIENGTCSKDCGYGVKVITTVVCQVSSSTSSSLDCKRTYDEIPCKIKDCPRKYL